MGTAGALRDGGHGFFVGDGSLFRLVRVRQRYRGEQRAVYRIQADLHQRRDLRAIAVDGAEAAVPGPQRYLAEA